MISTVLEANLPHLALYQLRISAEQAEELTSNCDRITFDNCKFDDSDAMVDALIVWPRNNQDATELHIKSSYHLDAQPTIRLIDHLAHALPSGNRAPPKLILRCSAWTCSARCGCPTQPQAVTVRRTLARSSRFSIGFAVSRQGLR